MVWLSGPRRTGGRNRGIYLHDPPPGYHPPRSRMSAKMLRRDTILLRVTTVVLVLLVGAMLVFIGLMIAGVR